VPDSLGMVGMGVGVGVPAGVGVPVSVGEAVGVEVGVSVPVGVRVGVPPEPSGVVLGVAVALGVGVDGMDEVGDGVFAPATVSVAPGVPDDAVLPWASWAASTCDDGVASKSSIPALPVWSWERSCGRRDWPCWPGGGGVATAPSVG
jgi:hypothetical protein